LTGAEIDATLVKPTLTDELKQKLIEDHHANSRFYAYLIWHDEEGRLKVKRCKWKAFAYQERGEMVQYDEMDMDQFLIVDIVDLNQL